MEIASQGVWRIVNNSYISHNLELEGGDGCPAGLPLVEFKAVAYRRLWRALGNPSDSLDGLRT